MTRLALITAINNYPAPNQLGGCINDALDWQTTLTNKGFSCGLLLDAWATKTNILNNLNSMVTNSRSGDSLVFVYSGHGSQVPDTNGDEPDGYDEVICTIDFFQGRYIKDDDLRSIFTKLPNGVTLDVFLDCCHAGTGTRLTLGKHDLKIKSIPFIGKPKKVKTITPVPTINHCLWSACKDNQLSREVKIGGKIRGAFSVYCASAIRANLSRSATIAIVQSKLAAIIPDQTPQLETTESEATQFPFV